MKLRWLACWLLCLVLMTGCGNDNQNLPTDSQGNQLLIQSNKSQLNSSVRILPSDDTIQVASLTDTTITLTGALPPLKVGDIVARPEGENQFLRRIASITNAPGGGVTITTSPVGLNEVFDSADINVTTFMGPEFLRTLESEIPGVTFGEPTRALAKTEEVAAWQLPVNFNEALINDGNRGSVNLNGNISLRVALQTELNVGLRNLVVPTVNHFVLKPIITVEGNLTVTGEGSGDFRKEVVLARLAHPLVGPFAPASLYLAGDLVIGVDGQVQSNGQITMSGRVDMEAGVDCTNDVWKPVSSVRSNFTAQAPQLFAEAKLNANVIQPRLTLSLLDMGQIFVNANILRFEVEAAATASSFNVNVFRTYNIEAGAKLVLSAKVFNVGFDLRYDGYLPPLNGPRDNVASISVGKPAPATNNNVLVLVIPTLLPTPGSNQLRLGEVAFFICLAGIGPFNVPLPVFADWSSSNSSAVQVRNLGFFGIAKAVGNGNADVRARFNGTSQGSFPAQVSSSGLSSLQIMDGGAAYRSESDVLRRTLATQNEVNLLDSLRYRAIGTYADGSQVDLSYSVNWSTPNPSQAKVFRNGQVLGVSSGLAQISASLSNLSALTNLTVNIPKIQHMHITPLDPAVISVDVGRTVQLKAVARDSNSNVREVTAGATWRSVSPSIATVDAGKVTGVKGGETIIEAVVSNGAVVASKRVRVNGLALASVEVEPLEVTSLVTNATQQFRAFARYSDGSREEVTTLAKWFSNNDGVGSISSTGLLTTKAAPGRIKVKATYGRQTGSSVPFEVTLPPVKVPGLRLRNALPTTSNVGRLLPLEVEILDGSAVDTSFNGDISVVKGPGSTSTGSLTGSTTVTAQNGVARFTNLSFSDVGDYQLVVSGAGAGDLTTNNIAVELAGFDTPTNPSTGTGTRPLGLAFGKLNSDDTIDLVTANGQAQNASVLANQGAGTFSTAVNQAIGANSPEDVAVADMNGDGKDDFVVVSQSTNGVHLFIRQPDDTFTRFDMAAQTNPFGVAVGPVTQGDTRPDIVVANVGSDSVTVFSQAPNGGYSATHFGVGLAPNAVALGDVNQDGRMDIVTSNFNSNSVSICYQNADGSFQVDSQTVSDRPEDVVLSDLDRDGRLDLSVACASGELTLLHQKTLGTFTRTNFTAGDIPVAVATGDINGDGLPDVVVGNLFSANVSYFQQNSSGGFDRTDFAAGVGPRAVVIVDLNGDGRLDIACANESSNTVTVILTK